MVNAATLERAHPDHLSPVDEALGATLALALALALPGGAADPVDAALADWDDVEPHATTNAALVPPSRAALRTVRRLNCRGETFVGVVDTASDRGELGASKAVTDRSSLLAEAVRTPTRDRPRIFVLTATAIIECTLDAHRACGDAVPRGLRYLMIAPACGGGWAAPQALDDRVEVSGRPSTSGNSSTPWPVRSCGRNTPSFELRKPGDDLPVPAEVVHPADLLGERILLMEPRAGRPRRG